MAPSNGAECSSSHLFQRVASFLQVFRIPASYGIRSKFSSLSESGFIPTFDMDKPVLKVTEGFSSLSESGFIPTAMAKLVNLTPHTVVLISFREWLHSYNRKYQETVVSDLASSHLFQRVASFLQTVDIQPSGQVARGSHLFQRVASFLLFQSPNWCIRFGRCSHLFQRVASFLRVRSLTEEELAAIMFSSLSESGFIPTVYVVSTLVLSAVQGSHLFQRVASFLHLTLILKFCSRLQRFSSLSESGFIPTTDGLVTIREMFISSHLFQRVASFLRFIAEIGDVF